MAVVHNFPIYPLNLHLSSPYLTNNPVNKWILMLLIANNKISKRLTSFVIVDATPNYFWYTYIGVETNSSPRGRSKKAFGKGKFLIRKDLKFGVSAKYIL